MKSLEGGELPEKLKNFLEINGVKTLHCDKSLKNALKSTGIEQKDSPIITRGVRMHLHKFLKNSGDVLQLRMASALLLAKANIKYDLEREDNVAISVGFELENVEKDIEKLIDKANTLLGWYFPGVDAMFKEDTVEFINIVLNEIEGTKHDEKDNEVCRKEIRNALENVLPEDLTVMKGYLTMIREKRILAQSLEKYLTEKLEVLAPNLREIVGDRLCFKMIHKAGGLMNLCLYPSSTVQLLGAEKALFRSLKAKSRTPKHGILYELECLESVRGDRRSVGKMCRYVATKCSLAARIDCFGDERSGIYGKELRKMIEKRIKVLKGAKTSAETATDVMKRVHKRLKEQRGVKD